jgi:hypothetical protein
MRTIKTLLLSAFLCCCYSADEMLILFERDSCVDVLLLLADEEYSVVEEYKYVPDNNVKKKTLLQNSTIVLEKSVRNDSYISRNIRGRAILEKRKSKYFFDDINKMKLITDDDAFVLCYEVYIYDQGKLITSFRTNGNQFYDRKNKLMYSSKEDLLRKYWGVLEENHCR